MPATANLPMLGRKAGKAALWARYNGTTLQKYIEGASAGQQYAGYFAQAVIQQADTWTQGTP